MTLLFRAAVILVLSAVIMLAVEEQKKPERPVATGIDFEKVEETVPELPDSYYQNPGAMLTYYILAGVLGGFVLLKWVLPAIGNKMEDAMFSAPPPGPQDAAARARALMAQGDFDEALTAWARAAQENPGDPTPVLAIAKIHKDKLQDPGTAIQVLETAAGGAWGAEQKAVLLTKLSELYTDAKNDYVRSRDLLQQVLTLAPGSAAEAEAHRQLQEIEEKEYLASRNNH